MVAPDGICRSLYGREAAILSSRRLCDPGKSKEENMARPHPNHDFEHLADSESSPILDNCISDHDTGGRPHDGHWDSVTLGPNLVILHRNGVCWNIPLCKVSGLLQMSGCDALEPVYRSQGDL